VPSSSPGKHRLAYFVVTRADLFAGTTTDAVSQLLAPFHEVPIDRAVAEHAGHIRRDTGVRLPDALIAATAVQLRMNLATRNDSDFKATEGLRIRKLA
jgi:predicted nucleic acid-binding protein